MSQSSGHRVGRSQVEEIHLCVYIPEEHDFRPMMELTRPVRCQFYSPRYKRYTLFHLSSPPYCE